jgi:hypothetical protein
LSLLNAEVESRFVPEAAVGGRIVFHILKPYSIYMYGVRDGTVPCMHTLVVVNAKQDE